MQQRLKQDHRDERTCLLPDGFGVAGVGASVWPRWQEPADKTRRASSSNPCCVRPDAQRSAAARASLASQSASFAPARAVASVDKQLPASPTLKSAEGEWGRQRARGCAYRRVRNRIPRVPSTAMTSRIRGPKPDPRTLPVELTTDPAVHSSPKRTRVRCRSTRSSTGVEAVHGSHPDGAVIRRRARGLVVGRHPGRQARDRSQTSGSSRGLNIRLPNR